MPTASQSIPDPEGGRGLSRFRTAGFRRAAACTAPLFPLWCLAGMDGMNAQGSWERTLSGWAGAPRSLLFEVLAVLLLFAALTLLLRRVWPAALLSGAVCVLFSYINYTKQALNGDPFFPQDMTLASHARELMSFLSGAVPLWFWFFALVTLLWILWFFLTGISVPGPLPARWGAVALAAVLTVFTAKTPGLRTGVLGAFGMSIQDLSDQGVNYATHGFVGGFTLNLLAMEAWVPEDYTEQTVKDLLAPYPPVPAEPGAEPFDVIVVLSESFSDVRELPGVTFSENPLPNYDAIRERDRCRSGTMYVTAMNGGTVRTEFAILTGLSMDHLEGMGSPYTYAKGDIPGYVRMYQDAGYATLALHPFDRTFYDRDRAYGWLGFDQFYSAPDVQAMTDVVWRRHYVSDATTTEIAIRLMEEQEKPTFLFVITMENHQPFLELSPEEIEITVDAPMLSEESYTALTTYVQGLSHADEMLKELTDWIDSRERPTLLVFFGDHRPNLGANHLAYNETGLFDSRDGFSPEEYQTVFRTPFICYSNRDLNWDLLPEQKENRISDYYLLDAAARAAGSARNSYMELLADAFPEVPYYNVRLQLPETDATRALDRAMELISYDRLLGSGWSNG